MFCKRRLALMHSRILFVSALALFFACSSDENRTASQRAMQDYLQALRAPDMEAAAPPAYPRQRQRQYHLEEKRYPFLDFLALENSELQRLIAERNSALGRVMQPVRQLAYEQHFLKIVLADTERGEKQEELAAVVAQKERELAKHYWNATFGGSEFASLWQASGREFGPDDDHALREVIGLLEKLEKIDYTPEGPALNVTEMEKTLDALTRNRHLLYRFSHYVGELSDALQAASLALQKGGDGLKNNRIRKAFQQNYREDIQPMIVRAHRNGRELFPLLQRVAEKINHRDLAQVKSFFAGLVGPESSAVWPYFQASTEAHKHRLAKYFERHNWSPFETK
jgi:hypothetical protein